MRRWLAALVLLCLCILPAYGQEPAPTTHIVADDDGGVLLAYIAKYWQWHVNGDLVRIEGECNSACTILLGIIESDHICAARNGEFGFHSASIGPGIYSEDGTVMLWSFYRDSRTERVLKKHGWEGPSRHPELIMIDAEEIVRPCKWEDYHATKASD